jgi:hypothetical protein
MIRILVGASLLVIPALICLVMAIRNRRSVEAYFPPISDEEFLARCPTGTNAAIALKARRIAADRLAVEYERVYPSSRFVGDFAE